MPSTLQIDQPSINVIPALICALQEQHLTATVSFDLQIARDDHAPCVCPYHGTEGCNCQYLVILVQDPNQHLQQLQAIIVRGRDNLTWLCLRKQATSLGDDEPDMDALEAKLLKIIFSLAVVPGTEVEPLDDDHQPPS